MYKIMIKRGILIACLIGSTALAMAIVYLNRDPLCISSKFVERIDNVTLNQVDSVFRCSQRRTVPMNSFLLQHMAQLQTKISAVEVFLNSFSVQIPPARIIFNDQIDFIISGQRIFLNKDQSNLPEAAQLALLKYWYRSQQQLGSGLPFLLSLPAENIFSGFLFRVLNEREFFNIGPKPRFGDLSSSSDYCEANQVSAADQTFCKNWQQQRPFENSNGPEDYFKNNLDKNAIEKWVVDFLWSQYLKMNLTQRQIFLKSFLAKAAGADQVFIEDEKSLLDLSEKTFRHTSAMIRYLTEDVIQTKKIKSFENDLYKAVFIADKWVDLDVYSGDLNKMSKDKKTTHEMWIEKGQRLWIYPKMNSFLLKSWPQLKALDKIVLLNEQKKIDNDFLRSQNNYQRLALLRLVKTDLLTDLDLQKFVESLLPNNTSKAVSFMNLSSDVMDQFEIVQIHKDSFQQMSVTTEHQDLLSVLKKAIQQDFRQLGLNWVDLKYDSKQAIYFPVSNSDSVLLFRFPR
ncbi:MAG: hypothetical protein ACOYOK_07460 [Pseudobdellovibrionaceae bacterium]